MIIWLITGLWILLGCAEAAHLITIMTNRSLQTYTALSSVFVLAGLLAYMGLLFIGKRRAEKRSGDMGTGSFADKTASGTGVSGAAKSCVKYLYVAVFVVLAGITLYHFVKGYVPDLQDAVYEITLGNVESGSIMTVHPFLGSEAEAAMPMRMQILGLSSLYSSLVTMSQQSPYIIMCKIIPLAVWGLSMMLYWAFAEKLFKEDVHKRWMFMSMIAFVYLATSGSTGLVGYRLFYAGFSGETIRSTLLMPYTIYVSWQKKWYLAVLAVFAEACLVWTTFGVGYCLLIAVCMFLVHLWLDRRGTHAA